MKDQGRDRMFAIEAYKQTARKWICSGNQKYEAIQVVLRASNDIPDASYVVEGWSWTWFRVSVPVTDEM